MPAFIRKPIIIDREIIEFLNSESGSTGLLALRSIRIRMAAKTNAAANRLRICGDPQSYWVPAQENPSSRATMLSERKTDPG
ncbi:hypothetical protein D3C87_1805390 [compost metagenome]